MVTLNRGSDGGVLVRRAWYNVAAASSVLPAGDDGAALGASGTAFSDLFLASGSVVNFNAGDVTLTHSAGKLTFGGDGAVELDFNSHEMTNVDINSGTIDGVTVSGTTITASTSFTRGDTVITDGVITDSTGLQLAAAVDLNNNTLSNVGAAGQDWLTGYLNHVGGGSGGEQRIRCDNTTTDGESIVQIWNAIGSGDAYAEIGVQGTYVWRVGEDNSEDDRFAICGNDAIGANDALRITAASPPVVSFNAARGSDFDYVCATCGKHGITPFTCCGLVEWHDDVSDFRGMARKDEDAMNYMEKVGVIQRSTNPVSGEPEIFATFNMVYFVGSMAYQNRERMDSQYEELDKRLEAIGA